MTTKRSSDQSVIIPPPGRAGSAGITVRRQSMGLDQQGQLGRGQEQRAVDDRWPDEPAPLQPLGEQAEAGASES